MSDTILAVDLGKYKCVACVYHKPTAAAEYRTVDTSRAEVEQLIRSTRLAVVVIEACTLSGWVSDLCGELGVPCRVANTASEAWKYKHTKRKTDRDDALRLAQLEALGQIPEVVVPDKRVREWRALIAHRQALVTQRVPGLTADQLQAAFDSAYEQKEQANQSSWVEGMKNLKKKSELDEKEVEDFHARMKVQASGGGFSVFGIGGGGSSYNQLSEADKKYHRDFARHFLDTLDFNETKGRFEVPKTTQHTLLTRAALTKALEQEFLFGRAGKVSQRVLSADFNTARPRLTAVLPERTTFGR